MRILIAEDDPISRRLLEANLNRIGYDVLACENGDQAWELLQPEDGPRIAVLDWMMPVMDGAEVCRRIRRQETQRYVYLILLTARGRKQDRAEGFSAGADDYLTKPFDVQELRAKITVGRRILDLQAALSTKVAELEEALCHVRQLQGLLPICMHCKQIRDDSSNWHPLEQYIERRSEAAFTHSLCPGCLSRHYPEIGEQLAAKREAGGK